MRCRFLCVSTTQRQHDPEAPRVTDATLNAFSSGDEAADKAIWELAPTGTLVLSTVQAGAFEAGTLYEIVITPTK